MVFTVALFSEANGLFPLLALSLVALISGFEPLCLFFQHVPCMRVLKALY